jgi:hypothetical protein
MVGSSRRRDLRSVLGARLRTLSATHLRQKAIRLPYAVTGGNEFQTTSRRYPASSMTCQGG